VTHLEIRPLTAGDELDPQLDLRPLLDA
jgi:hypothetical protein